MRRDSLQVGKIGYVTDGRDVPENAIILTTEKIQKLQKKLIENWSPQREMAPLKYGDHILGGVAALSGVVIGSYFRGLMMLRNHSKFLMLGPTAFFPFLFTSMGHNIVVTQNALVGRIDCSTCLDIRSILVQVSCGVVQPIALSLIGGTILAKRFSTYPLPPLNDYKTMTQIYINMLKAMRTQAVILTALQVASAVIMNRRQSRAIFKVNEKIVSGDSTLN